MMVARLFNPIGPGTPTSQALGLFASRLVEAEHDPLELTVGDLDSRRDFIDVRDVARAMVALATRGQAGLVYHVGTGKSQRVGDGLDRLMQVERPFGSSDASTRYATTAAGPSTRVQISIGS